jgi:uncharacterized membrane protein YtjA (UPF0391 family)
MRRICNNNAATRVWRAEEGGDRPGSIPKLEEFHMLLTWALIFAVVALIAGVFGFGGVASAAAGVARILFFIFLVVFLVTLIAAIL